MKATVVAEGTEFKGSFSSDCPIVVKGVVEGDVMAPSLTVEPSGTVQGDVAVGISHTGETPDTLAVLRASIEEVTGVGFGNQLVHTDHLLSSRLDKRRLVQLGIRGTVLRLSGRMRWRSGCRLRGLPVVCRPLARW